MSDPNSPEPLYEPPPISHETFDEFLDNHPLVYKLFKQFTFQVIDRGFAHYSANGIIERIRWHTTVELTGFQFKINNNWTAFLARKFHEDFPQHDGFFRTRRSIADAPKDSQSLSSQQLHLHS